MPVQAQKSTHATWTDLLLTMILCLYHMMLQRLPAAFLQYQLLRWFYRLYIQNMTDCPVPVLGVHIIWQNSIALCRILPKALQSRQELSRLSLTAMKPMKCPYQSPGTAASTPSRNWLYYAASALIRYFDVLFLCFGWNQHGCIVLYCTSPGCDGAA